MNTLTLTGNLTADPELADAGDKPVCEMRLAVDNGRYPTTYVDVRTFGEHAYACAEFLTKGRKIGVSGRLIYDEWHAPDGSKRSRHSVIGRVEFLSPRPAPEPGSTPELRPLDLDGDPEAPALEPELALVS